MLTPSGGAMKTIVTAGGSFFTGTEVADAVTGYGLALARRHALDVVEIPFLTAAGAVHRVQIRIGWQVDLLVTFDEKVAEELIEPDTILGILGKTRALEVSGRRQHSVRESGHQPVVWDEVDWDEVI